MIAAKLDQRITIEKKTIVKNGHGTPSETWSEIAARSASVEETNGSKPFNTDTEGFTHQFNTVFTFRWLSSFGHDCRIIFNSEVFEILSIDPLRRKEGFKVIAKRKINNG
jgi:head-tail adaptor